MSDNIGSFLQEGGNNALKTIAIGAGVVVYLGMLLFSGVHNYTLMTRGVVEDLLFWAVLGVFTLEISAAFLPIALHAWTYAPLQRIAAYVFYGLDFALIIGNVVLDFTMNSGGTMPDWMNLYLSYLAPATPVIPGIGWSILFLLDPSHQARAVAERLKAAAIITLAAKIEKRTKEQDINLLVDDAAGEMARALVAQAMGASVERAGGRLPASIIEAAAKEPHPTSNGRDKHQRNGWTLFRPRHNARTARMNSEASANPTQPAGKPAKE